MEEICIIGAGGHGREILRIINDINEIENRFRVLGFIDDNPNLNNTTIAGLAVIGNIQWILKHPKISYVLGIGSPEIKKTIINTCSDLNLKFPNLVHPSAQLSKSISFGAGVVIFPLCCVSVNVSLGDHVCLNSMVNVSHDSKIGKFSILNPGSVINGNVNIGDAVYIGSKSVIIQNITVGSQSIIGAGTVVIRDIPEKTTSVGVPSRIIKTHP